jgi:hypothetical protein
MENIEYICDLIIKNDSQIYFDDEEHFMNFLESPKNVLYNKQYTNNNCNVLFYLTYEKYDLIEKVIDYGLFDKIDINQNLSRYQNKLNILMFSCLFSKKYSSYKIIKILLGHPDIDVNSQDDEGWSALMLASRYSNTSSTQETVKILLEHSFLCIDINLQNHNGCSALILASKYSNTDSTEGTVKILLEHPNIDVNLHTTYGWSALIFASRYLTTYSTINTIKMLLEHPNINVNLQDRKHSTALMFVLEHLNIFSTEKAIKMLLEHPNIDINLRNYYRINTLALSLHEDTGLHKMRIIWKLFMKHKIKHNMFYLYEERIDNNHMRYIDGLKEYMKFQRYNLINHRRYYRKNILNKKY